MKKSAVELGKEIRTAEETINWLKRTGRISAEERETRLAAWEERRRRLADQAAARVASAQAAIRRHKIEVHVLAPWIEG